MSRRPSKVDDGSSTIVDREEQKQMMEAFSRFDVNKDGVIERSELATVLMELDPEVWTKKSVKSLMKEIDKNGDGEVQLDEFIAWVSNSGKKKTAGKDFENVVRAGSKEALPSEAEQMLQAFAKFDANGDGIIQREELAAVLTKAAGGGSCWNEATVASLATAIDKNGDGNIEYHEFVDWVCNADKKCPAQTMFHTHIQGADPETRAKSEALAKEAKTTLSSFTAADIDDMRCKADVDGVVIRPKAGVDSVCIAVMYLLAGLDPNIKINFSGRPREATWVGAQKMMKNAENFRSNLDGLIQRIDDGEVPPISIAGARDALDEVEYFDHKECGEESIAAGLLYTFTRIVIEYYATVAPEGHAAAADAPSMLVAATPKACCDTAEDLALNVLGAFDSVSSKDVLDLKVMCGARGGEDQLQISLAMMQLVASLNLNSNVAVDAGGNLKEPNKKGAQKFLSKFGGLRDLLKALTVIVDEKKVPAQNIEGARALVGSFGSSFSYDTMKQTSIAAAEISSWVTNMIKYYDGIGAGTAPKGKIAHMLKAGEGLANVNKGTLVFVRMAIPPACVQKVFFAAMHLLGGLDLDSGVKVDGDGKLLDPSWDDALIMLECPEKFVANLNALTETYLHPDKLPSSNVEGARAICKGCWNEFDITEEFKPGDPKEVGLGLLTFMRYVIMYYDALGVSL